ncbi:platelet-derived growth factor subunit B [Passer montanus]|uniref:platelet-derived growth factor subunit B n=1 Tax=Passer montanus TaxID=9160 RepID=UPI0019618A9D|nr:platelet-derived growth factor subunit B [Passer montanus]XP_039581416.1 platelet-derived growth factor subunit B [Passer montanus]XP_039581417.1 platelet-derived growth factor subunit B [Passer montanus]
MPEAGRPRGCLREALPSRGSPSMCPQPAGPGVGMNFGVVFAFILSLPLARMEGDPIPEDIYEILGGSSVRSISDLQRALRIDSVEQDSSSLSLNASQPDQNPVALSRERRSLDALAAAETAVLAECKTREVVFEISRNMVDSTNANFVVWPPCVEVQRCSGCCNNRNVQCRPTQIRVRHVQVNKIEFVQRKPKFTKVVVPLEDHVQCRCEAVFRPPPRNIRPGPREQRRLSPAFTTAAVSQRRRVRRPPAQKRKHKKYKHVNDKKVLKEILIA